MDTQAVGGTGTRQNKNPVRAEVFVDHCLWLMKSRNTFLLPFVVKVETQVLQNLSIFVLS